MRLLKQSTAVNVPIGPFLDDTDGKTAETALTVAYTAVYLSKNGGAFAAKNNTTNPNHGVNGQYYCTLSTTDTNTLGTLRLSVVIAGALQVWEDFMVIPAAVYDAFVGGTANMPSDMIAISGDTVAADNCEKFFDGTGYAGTNNVIPSVTTVTGNVNGSVGSVTAVVSANMTQISGDNVAADNCEAMFDGTGYAGGTIPLQVDAKLVSASSTAADNLELLALNAKGSDHKVLISANAQDLSASLDVRTKAVGAGAVTSTAIASGAFTASAFATDAIAASAIKADAVTKIAAGVFAFVVEGTRTFKDHIRLAVAALCGKASGGGTSTVTFRDASDTKNRISMTVDANGNRTAVTLDATD